MGRALFLLIFILLLYLIISQASFFLKYVYPFHYREAITAAAENNKLDPLLIAAMIWVESGFDEKAESDKGAIGLMQIMPETGLWAAEQMGFSDFTAEKLFDPYISITIGSWYLGQLLDQFNRNTYAALAAYNGGRGHVSSWLENGTWDGSRENLADIPFPETFHYIKRIERVYQRYSNIYK